MFFDADHSGISPGDLTSGVCTDFSTVDGYGMSRESARPAAVRPAQVCTTTNGRSMNSTTTGNPSPAQPAAAGVYEVKFIIDEAKGMAIREWARQHLQPDPHSSPELGFGYSVNSLYLDTPDFDVYRRGEGFRQRKYRLRRYGAEAAIWMELKRKTDGQVSKRRVRIPDSDLLSRISFAPDETWEGHWFQQRLQELKLHPVCQVTYQRFACIGTSSTGPVRLTIDSHVSSRAASGWHVPTESLSAGALLKGQQILELKYRESVPALFRGLIEDHRLVPGSFSKYRQSVEACIPLQQLMGNSSAEQIAG